MTAAAWWDSWWQTALMLAVVAICVRFALGGIYTNAADDE